jgi:isopenicillin N synthase-like dioxygenase
MIHEISLAPLLTSSPVHEDLKRLGESVHRACRDVGFFSVTDFGIEAAELTAALALVDRFFNQAEPNKEDLDAKKSILSRG